MKDFKNRTGFSDERVREEIQDWLKGSLSSCPFSVLFCSKDEDGARLCRQVFPRLDKRECPCNHYSLKYVIRIAKQAIRELGG